MSIMKTTANKNVGLLILEEQSNHMLHKHCLMKINSQNKFCDD